MPKKSRFPIVRKEWPRIIDYRQAPQRCLMLDARPHGKREYPKTIGEAKARADQLATERANKGTEAIGYSTENRVMAVECTERLRPFGKTLRDATDHYVDWLNSEAAKRASLLVSACVEEYIAAREADEARGDLDKGSLGEIRGRVRLLSSALAELHIGEVTPDVVQTFLNSIPHSARTRHNIRLRISKFFNFCKAKGWLDRNPCEVVKVKVKRSDTEFLTVLEAQHLLNTAAGSKFAEIAVPYAAICLFAGLRPGEAEQLDWEQVDVKTKSIHVLSHTSKKRETRYVAMEPTLLRWLKPHARKTGRVVGSNFRKQWESVKRAAGYDPADKESKWVPDVMRHSYASYWLAVHQNRAQLAELMGTSVEVIRKHYRQPILKAEAKRYWAL